jgi:hypothetical protein
MRLPSFAVGNRRLTLIGGCHPRIAHYAGWEAGGEGDGDGTVRHGPVTASPAPWRSESEEWG